MGAEAQRVACGAGPHRRYFLALVWSTGEVLTVGSDIHPTTDSERAFQVVARVLAGLMYAYLLGAVCSIFTAMSRDRVRSAPPCVPLAEASRRFQRSRSSSTCAASRSTAHSGVGLCQTRPARYQHRLGR
jgi:hypothetical protein